MTNEQLAYRSHEEWRCAVSERDTKRLLPEARRRVRALAPHLERLGLNTRRVLKALRQTVVERRPIEKAGYLCEDWERRLFIIEVNEDLHDVEQLRLTRWHEVAHLVCWIGGRGLSHGPVWRAVIRLLGFPEEAREFPDVV